MAREVLPDHARVKFVPESRPVARKEVMAVQPYQEYPKFVPLDKSSAGNEVSALQSYHAA